MQKGKVLVVINSFFPFSWGEAFLESEYKHWQSFEKVFIAPCEAADQTKMREVSIPNAEVVRLNCKSLTKIEIIKGILKGLLSKYVWQDIIYLLKTKKADIGTFYKLFSMHAVADKRCRELLGHLKQANLKAGNIVFYAYWFHMPALVAVNLKRRFPGSKVISRSHRFDLYEYMHKNDYIPLRRCLLKNLDMVYPVSDDGTAYLKERYPQYSAKIQTSRLGTNHIEHTKQYSKRKPLRLVSCSSFAPVKRVGLICDALALVQEEVHWTHFGGGEGFDAVKAQADALPENIKVDFRGNVPNKEILQEYAKNAFDLFINVSSSEGVPVSIMEAMSFGMPVIATAVGGTGEIVHDKVNGVLLDKDFSINQLCEKISAFSQMGDDEYIAFCQNSRRIWEELCDANKNYSRFVAGIENL